MSKGQVHEGIIRVTDKGSVITWDFDVMRHDVVFTVYRLKHPLRMKSPNATPTPTPTGAASFNYPSKKSDEAGPKAADSLSPPPAASSSSPTAASKDTSGQSSSNSSSTTTGTAVEKVGRDRA